MTKMITCSECGEIKPHKAFGLCNKCYQIKNKKKVKIKYCQICKKEIKYPQQKYCQECKKEVHIKQIQQYYKNNKFKWLFKYDTNQWYRELNPNMLSFEDKEYRINVSCRQQGINRSEWNGFVSYGQYCSKFNNECKESNRDKYDRLCFICGKDEEANGQRLSVHHVDMNKNQGCDNIKWKLVPLCQSCHHKVHNKLWKSRLEYLLILEIINEI